MATSTEDPEAAHREVQREAIFQRTVVVVDPSAVVLGCALAEATGEPPLHGGDGFTRTDVRSALTP